MVCPRQGHTIYLGTGLLGSALLCPIETQNRGSKSGLSSLIVPLTATRLSASASDQEILGVARDWARALAAQDYERAHGMTAHDPYYGWSASLIRQVGGTGTVADEVGYRSASVWLSRSCRRGAKHHSRDTL